MECFAWAVQCLRDGGCGVVVAWRCLPHPSPPGGGRGRAIGVGDLVPDGSPYVAEGVGLKPDLRGGAGAALGICGAGPEVRGGVVLTPPVGPL